MNKQEVLAAYHRNNAAHKFALCWRDTTSGPATSRGEVRALILTWEQLEACPCVRIVQDLLRFKVNNKVLKSYIWNALPCERLFTVCTIEEFEAKYLPHAVNPGIAYEDALADALRRLGGQVEVPEDRNLPYELGGDLTWNGFEVQVKGPDARFEPHNK